MKNTLNLLLLMGFLLIGKVSWGDCEVQDLIKIYKGNADQSYNLASHFNNNYSCGGSFSFDEINFQSPMQFAVSSSFPLSPSGLTALKNSAMTGEIDFSLWGEIMMNDVLWVPDVTLVKIIINQYQNNGVLQGGTASANIEYDFYFFFPRSTSFNLNVLCTQTSYSLNQLFSFPANTASLTYTNKSYDFSSGNVFDQLNNITFSPVSNDELIVDYHAKVESNILPPFTPVNVKKRWIVDLHAKVNVDWTNAPVGLTENSADVILNQNYLVQHPYPVVNEFFGAGIYSNGTDFLFSPGLAGGGNHVLSYRANNLGCFSDWADTIFPVTPVVSVNSPPQLNMNQTFGPGLNGERYLYLNQPPYIDYEGQPEPGFVMGICPFHFVCSDRDYTLFIQNPDPNLSYEWKVLFHSEIISQGFGDSYTITMPLADNILTDEYYGMNESVHDTVQHYFIGDENGHTNKVGDLMEIYIRSINAVNEHSNWRKAVFGVVPAPAQDIDDLLYCYTNLVNFDLISNTPIYDSGLDVSTVRSFRLNYNSDPLWEYTGDGTTYDPATSAKLKEIRAQSIDSTYMYVYDSATDQWMETWSDAGEVCYSSIDTAKLVKTPVFTVQFNVQGTVNYGSAVVGIVSGSYFNGTTDDVLWNWSDGSPQYNQDTLWHFLNDLGHYSLNVEVVDSFGCSSSIYFDSLWYTPGTLSVDEEELEEFLLYPVPVVDDLTIKSSWPVVDVEIYNALGALVLSEKKNVISCLSLQPGVYFVKVRTERGVVIKNIVKK